MNTHTANNMITPEIAHDKIIAYMGKNGWFPMNDYLELRNIILFGESRHDYVPNIDELVSGDIIDKALKMMQENVVVRISGRWVTPERCRKPHFGYAISIFKMGAGGYKRGDVFHDGRFVTEKEKAIDYINSGSANINELLDTSKSRLYITGDRDLVEQVATNWNNAIVM